MGLVRFVFFFNFYRRVVQGVPGCSLRPLYCAPALVTEQSRLPSAVVREQCQVSQAVVLEQCRVTPAEVIELYMVPPAVVLD